MSGVAALLLLLQLLLFFFLAAPTVAFVVVLFSENFWVTSRLSSDLCNSIDIVFSRVVWPPSDDAIECFLTTLMLLNVMQAIYSCDWVSFLISGNPCCLTLSFGLAKPIEN